MSSRSTSPALVSVSPTMRSTSWSLVIALGMALGLAGCEESSQVREWRPEDHVQPASPDPARVPESDADPAVVQARAADALFRAQCASCHGADGRGGGPMAVPDLSSPAYHGERSDEAIAQGIREGRGAMPGFGDRINDRGIAALVRHVRSLSSGGPIGPAEGAADD